MKALDWPPLWTLAFVALAWVLAQVDPFVFGTAARGLAAVLMGMAILLSVWAAATMARAKTTVIPHREPTRLVTWGPFAWSRNPIYLADLFVVVAAALWFGSPLAVLLALPLAVVLSHRFIRAEEARLAEHFATDWGTYSASVRRWV